MRIRTTTIVLICCTALLAAACGGGAERSSAAGEGSTYQATIRRTDGGVPHITADSVANLSFGQGWASGQDRTCDLANAIVRINGEQARWFGRGEGDANVKADIATRTIGLRQIADDDWPTASERVREAITAFAAGWNGHLEETGVNNLAGWCAGAEWVRPLEPIDIYAWARSVALLASGAAVENYVATAEPPAVGNETASAPADGPIIAEAVGSNAWAIGAERSAEGGGMLIANPHFPWEGALRFWEVHLTIPGELDVYGAQLSGLPGIGIGFTESFAWTHTVSAGNRFTAYLLDLVPGEPTSYRYGDEVRQMTPTDITVEILGEDGQLTTETVTRWSTHYGPVLDFPGVGWTDTTVITMRDANIDNDEFIEQYVAMLEAKDLDGLIEAHRTYQGVPVFNTIATSADGRAWYADTAATPKLSDAAIEAYGQLKRTNLLVSVAADNRAVLLDGSDPLFEWEAVEGSRDPGLVPFDEMPVLERSDYVFNANDSFWMSHATELLAGTYSPLHGLQDTVRSPRTRENATVLDDTSANSLAGADGQWTLDELAAAALDNTGFTARAVRQEVVERCTGVPTVTVEALAASQGGSGLPAGTVEIGDACQVLAGWDGRYNLDSVGAVVWREFAARDIAWRVPFNPADPLGTPSGLAPVPAAGADPALVNLARAVQTLEAAGLAVDVSLGEVQVAVRNGTLVPIHGGNGTDGTANQVNWAGASALTQDPLVKDLRRTVVAAGSPLARVTGGGAETTGYRIGAGTSFLMAVAYTPEGVQARTFLTYSNTEDRSSPDYIEATRRFSAKQWRTVPFTPDAVEAATTATLTVRG
jgi:acyl-homoserine-lactone acylase